VAGRLSDAAFVGVDGCRAGWVAAGLDAGGEWSFDCLDGFEGLWAELDRDAVEQVLVDVPIGLADDQVRACDEAARDLLGCRWNSVFRTPVRGALEMKREEGPDEDRRPAASDHNDDQTGNGVSVQAWNIADGVLELDDFLADRDLPLDGPVREAHPELAFMAFNGQPVAYSKRDDRGAALRRSLLDGERPGTSGAVDAVAFDDVGDDDVLDAAALALAARGDLATVPEEPEEGQPRIYFPERDPAWGGQSYFSG
jgi:predicted RNase H-like nuclease